MSFLQQSLAIDLGTANTVISKDDKVVLDEPSIIAVEAKTGKMVAIGTEAQLIEEHTNPRIYTVRPLMNGVIADYDAAEMMLTGFIRKALGSKRSLFRPTLKLVIGIPGGSTPVDMRSIRDSATHAGARDPMMIYEPMASALGIGLDVLYQRIVALRDCVQNRLRLLSHARLGGFESFAERRESGTLHGRAKKRELLPVHLEVLPLYAGDEIARGRHVRDGVHDCGLGLLVIASFIGDAACAVYHAETVGAGPGLRSEDESAGMAVRIMRGELADGRLLL